MALRAYEATNEVTPGFNLRSCRCSMHLQRQDQEIVIPYSRQTPRDSRFSLPSNRYFNRHHLPPAGETSRYSPRPSKSLAVLLWGLAFRSAVSVRGMGATPSLWTHLPLNIAPSCPRMSMESVVHLWMKNREQSNDQAAFRMSLELLG